MSIWFRSFKGMALLSAALLIGCNSGSNANSSNVGVAQAEKDKAAKTESLPGVDTTKLDDSSKSMFSSLVNDLLSPCGEASSVAQCVVQKQKCAKCVPAARFVLRLVDSGYTRDEINQAYRTRYDDSGKAKLTEQDCPTEGATMAPVTLQVFSDFQCPHCRIAAPLIHQMIDKFPGKVRIVYRNFPLSAHTFARDAARAAVAAHMQGKFKVMHDLLFQNQEELSAEKIVALAQEAGLDMKRFKKDYESKTVAAIVDRDRKEGEVAGIQGTPTIFVNGRKYDLAFEELPQYIQEELGG